MMNIWILFIAAAAAVPMKASRSAWPAVDSYKIDPPPEQDDFQQRGVGEATTRLSNWSLSLNEDEEHYLVNKARPIQVNPTVSGNYRHSAEDFLPTEEDVQYAANFHENTQQAQTKPVGRESQVEGGVGVDYDDYYIEEDEVNEEDDQDDEDEEESMEQITDVRNLYRPDA